MAEVTGMTAAAINEELDKMIVSISVDEETGIMYAHPRNGDPITAGPAISPNGAVSAAYPIGSIYINAGSSTNPATLLGVGTWTRYGKGRTIVSLDEAQVEFDSLGETGGAKTHDLQINEIPSHIHSMAHTHPILVTFNLTETNYSTDTNLRLSNFDFGTAMNTDKVGATGDSSAAATGAAGGGDPHNNLQPYIVAYVWRRTA
jgi:hypothetical protein